MRRLRKIYTRHFPARGYRALTLFCWMFVRSEYRDAMPWYTDNHEEIHHAQYRELGYLPFLPLYGLEYLVKLVLTRSHGRAYRSISFEQEAYRHQFDADYPEMRRHYAWARYVFKTTKI